MRKHLRDGEKRDMNQEWIDRKGNEVKAECDRLRISDTRRGALASLVSHISKELKENEHEALIVMLNTALDIKRIWKELK